MQQTTTRAVWWMVAHVPTLGLLTPLAVLDVAGRDTRPRTLAGATVSALAVLVGIVLVAAARGAVAQLGAAALTGNFLGGLLALSGRIERTERDAARPRSHSGG